MNIFWEWLKIFIIKQSYYYAMGFFVVSSVILFTPLFLSVEVMAGMTYLLNLRLQYLPHIILVFLISTAITIGHTIRLGVESAQKKRIKKLKSVEKELELKQKREEEEKQIKTEEEYKIQLIKTLTSRQKETLKLFDNENKVHKLILEWEVKDMIEKNILKVVSMGKPFGTVSGLKTPIQTGIVDWVLKIVTQHQELLD